jgi:hypothetical protein
MKAILDSAVAVGRLGCAASAGEALCGRAVRSKTMKTATSDERHKRRDNPVDAPPAPRALPRLLDLAERIPPTPTHFDQSFAPPHELG